jgi:hypothetical protein
MNYKEMEQEMHEEPLTDQYQDISTCGLPNTNQENQQLTHHGAR